MKRSSILAVIVGNLGMTMLFCLCLMNPIAFAQGEQPTALKIEGSLTQSQEDLIVDTFSYLNKFWADQGKSLSQDITEKYFDPDTTLIINGKTVYIGYSQLENHFKKVTQSTREITHFPLLKIISVGDTIVVHFNVDIYDKNGNYFPSNAVAIFTLKNNRILKWENVVNSKYFSQPESEKIIYSH